MKAPDRNARKGGSTVGARRATKAPRIAVKASRAKLTRCQAVIPAVAPIPDQKRPGGKLGHVLDAIAGKHGASLDELVKLTDWQPHTTRAAVTRLRQRGFGVGLSDTDGRKAYRLTETASR